MKFKRKNSGTVVVCDTLLGVGGEGSVYSTDVPGMVAKIYHGNKRPNSDLIAKLSYMICNTPEQPQSASNHIAITWPRDMLMRGGEIHGFLMDISQGESIDKAMSPRDRKRTFPGLTWNHGLAMAHNLAWVMANVHSKDYVVGDVNVQNVRVLAEGLISIIDIDSFQIRDSSRNKVYPCTVTTPEYAAPEITGEIMLQGKRSANQDCFSLAVIVYGLLMCGNHPFAGVYKQEGDPPELGTAIKRGYTVFDPSGPFSIRPSMPPLSFLPPEIHRLFERCFLDGHAKPDKRPSAQEWKDALWRVYSHSGGYGNGTKTCAKSDLHIYPVHLESCPWCELWNRVKVDYYDPRVVAPPAQRNRPRTVRDMTKPITPVAVAGAQIVSPLKRLPALPATVLATAPLRTHPRSAPTPQVLPARYGGSSPRNVRPSVGSGGQSGRAKGSIFGKAFRFISKGLGVLARVALALVMLVYFLWLNFAPPSFWSKFGFTRFAAVSTLTSRWNGWPGEQVRRVYDSYEDWNGYDSAWTDGVEVIVPRP